MFRYEIGANILIKKYGWAEHDPIEVKLIAKASAMGITKWRLVFILSSVLGHI